jgi:hypothetical protein
MADRHDGIGHTMTIEEIDKIITDLRNQIPNLQMQLYQAEGYKQALVDLEKSNSEEEEPETLET